MAKHDRNKLWEPNPNKSMAFNLRGKKVMFFHLPKTGGQSIYKAFGKKIQTHTPLSHPARQHELAQSSYSFAFVRHPLDRCVSFFYWVKSLHKEFNKGRRAEHYALNILSRDMTVDEFYKRFDFAYWDHCSYMLRPQAWMLQDPKTKRLDPRVNLFQFEKFSDEYRRLCLALGFTDGDMPKLPHVNSTGSKMWENEVLSDEVVEKLVTRNMVDFQLLPFYDNPLE
jgi:hypothetical protein